MTCDLCLSNSGRTNAKRGCCVLLDLAQSPRHVREAYAASLTETERDELRPRMKVEMERLKELRKAIAGHLAGLGGAIGR